MDWLRKNLAKPEIQYWPELRWWLAEGLHTDETLKNEIDWIYRNGFGAVEFLAMDEDGADSSRYGWGSEEWVHDSHTIIDEATKRKMGISVTSGTNWATANLTTILPDDKAAAKELNFTFETLAGGESRTGSLSKPAISNPCVHDLVLVAVVAGKRLFRTDKGAVLDKESLAVLTGEVKDNCLDWTAPEGECNWELLCFWMHGTGQTATPAQGIAYTVNYVDRYGVDALIGYWDKAVLTKKMKDLIKENGRVQMYMDSLELKTFGQGGQFWGYTLLEEFKKRRAYDLTPYLPYVVRYYDRAIIGMHSHFYESQDDDFTARIRNDLCQTQTELYIDNMLKPLRKWLRRAGMSLRAEISYGMPYEISLPGKYVDGIAGESLDFAGQPEAFRGFAGMAFLFNKPYSSETGAHRHNYMMGLHFYNQIIFTQFASGVSRSVLHGYSSICGSENSTRWPGHEGMWPVFSDRFDRRQPFARHFPEWTAMLARFQMILRQGEPRRDILMLRLDYHFNGKLHRNNGIRDKTIYETMYLRAHRGIYWRDMALQDAGYTYDYIAPQLLEEREVSVRDGIINGEGPAYRGLVIFQEALPLSSAKRIYQFARAGLKVIIVNGVTEMIRNEIFVTHKKAACKTPYLDGKDGELAEIMAEMKKLPNVKIAGNQKEVPELLREMGVKPRAGFVKPNAKILTFTRDTGDMRYVFVYHYMYLENKAFSFAIEIEGEGKPFLVDCWRNEIRELGKYKNLEGFTRVELTLAPGEAAVIALEIGGKDAFHAVDAEDCEVIKKEGKLFLKTRASGACTAVFNDASKVKKEITVPESITLSKWNLTVENWDQGEKKIIEEDRGLGYISREVCYETKKTLINAGKTRLKPWKDIPRLGPEVSGIGYYETGFILPAEWNTKHGAVLSLDNANGCSVAVYVNGKKAPMTDYAVLETDITAFLVPGENRIKIEAASTLCNRLIARRYYDGLDDTSGMIVNGRRRTVAFDVLDYGLTGNVKINFYTLEEP
jgi:hypothetical protein